MSGYVNASTRRDMNTVNNVNCDDPPLLSSRLNMVRFTPLLGYLSSAVRKRSFIATYFYHTRIETGFSEPLERFIVWPSLCRRLRFLPGPHPRDPRHTSHIGGRLFMKQTDSTVIATSLPAIASDIGTQLIALKLALTAYFVALAIFIPSVAGWPTASERKTSSASPFSCSWSARWPDRSRFHWKPSCCRASCRASAHQ